MTGANRLAMRLLLNDRDTMKTERVGGRVRSFD